VTLPTAPWEQIGDFRSPGEFDRFVTWMQVQVENGVAAEVAVTSPYLDATFSERWFHHQASGEIWRVVWPDPPFTGLFERVK
jgi:hypothetical protein